MFNYIQHYQFNPKNQLNSAVSLGHHDPNKAISAVADPLIKRAGIEFKPDTTNRPESLDQCLITNEVIKEHSLLQQLSADTFPNIAQMWNATKEEDAVIRIAANFIGGGLITGGNKLH